MEWKPIETAPKDGTPVLLFYKSAVKYGEWYHSKRKDSKTGWRIYHSGIYSSVVVDTPTHWMPLPDAPLF